MFTHDYYPILIVLLLTNSFLDSTLESNDDIDDVEEENSDSVAPANQSLLD